MKPLEKPQVWNKDEELTFLKELTGGKSMEDISKLHNRSQSALDLRLKKIIFDNITAGKTEEGLGKMFNMAPDKIKQYYYEYKGFLEKKGKLEKTVNEINVNVGGSTSLEPVVKEQPKKPNEPVIKNPTFNAAMENIKTNNIVLNGGKQNELSNKPKNMLSKVSRLNKIEKENQVMKSMLDNISLKKRINKLIKDGVIDSKYKKIIKKIAKQI